MANETTLTGDQVISNLRGAGYNTVDMANQARINTNQTSANVPSPSSLGSSPINSDMLAPTKSITPVATPTPTETPALLGTVDAQAKAYTNSVIKDDEVAATKAAKESSMKALTEKVTAAPGTTALTATEYDTAGVDKKKSELNTINNQITAEQVALQRKLEKIDKNEQGKIMSALNADKRNAEVESARRQADLSVIALAKQNDYYGAKEVADRKVTAMLEDQKKELEALQFTYNENKESFTKAEQRQFETNQAERTRLLAKEETELKAINDRAIKALENGAPTDLVRSIQNAKTEKEAIQIGAAFMASPQYTFKTLSDGRDVMLDKQGNIVKVVSGAPLSKEDKEKLAAIETSKKQIPVLEDKLTQIDKLLADDSGLNGAVGPNFLYRLSDPSNLITSARQNFISGVSQLTSRETLDTLLNLKKAGGTLGALSEKELEILNSAASKINSWAITEKDDAGNIRVKGYNISEKLFKEELAIIRKLTERAINEANGTTLSNTELLNTIPPSTVSNKDFFNSISGSISPTI
jgi:hypothetical protein